MDANGFGQIGRTKKLDKQGLMGVCLIRGNRTYFRVPQQANKQTMGQTARTTKLLLDLSPRAQGGTNTGKRHALEETVALLNQARRFYLEFFLAHPEQLLEQVAVLSS